jgi:hypothetical protein
MIFYKDRWLAKNSEGYRLYKEGNLKKLDELIKDVDKRHKELLAKYK